MMVVTLRRDSEMELSTVETKKISGFCLDSDSYNHIPLKFVLKTSRRTTAMVTWKILIFKRKIRSNFTSKQEDRIWKILQRELSMCLNPTPSSQLCIAA